MEDLNLAALGLWAWFLAAAVLMTLELAVPGAFLVWLGLAAAATGLVDLIVDLPWQREVLLFAILAIAFAIIGRNIMRRQSAKGHDKPFLNRRTDAFIGRDFVLTEPIVGGAGSVRVDDSIWRVVGPDLPVGSAVRVVRVDGAALVVEPR